MENSSECSEQSDLPEVQEMSILSTELGNFSSVWTDDEEDDEDSDSDDSEDEALKAQLAQVEDLAKKFQAAIAEQRKQVNVAEIEKSQTDQVDKLTGELLELRLQKGRQAAQIRASIRERNKELYHLETQLENKFAEFNRDRDTFLTRAGVQPLSDAEILDRMKAPNLEVSNEWQSFDFVSKESGADDPKETAKKHSDEVGTVKPLGSWFGSECYIAFAFIKENGKETKIAGYGQTAVEASDDLLERLEQYLLAKNEELKVEEGQSPPK